MRVALIVLTFAVVLAIASPSPEVDGKKKAVKKPKAPKAPKAKKGKKVAAAAPAAPVDDVPAAVDDAPVDAPADAPVDDAAPADA